ncbi:MAG: hypothetical protein AAB601_00140, partial [Patescibacteria group bacterium]
MQQQSFMHSTRLPITTATLGAFVLLLLSAPAHAAPRAPENVQVAPVSSCAIEVRWDQPEAADHFGLRGIVSSFESYLMTRLSNWPNYPLGFLTGAGSKTYLDTYCANEASDGPNNLYLDPGSTRRYEVSACDSGGDCSTAPTTVQVTTPSLPGNVPRPADVLATGTSSTRISLTFTTSSAMTENFLPWGGFLVDRDPDIPDLDIFPKYFTADLRNGNTYFYEESVDAATVYRYTARFFESDRFCYTKRLYEEYPNCRAGNLRRPAQTSLSPAISMTVPLRVNLFTASYDAVGNRVLLRWQDTNSGGTNETHYRILRNTADEFSENRTGNLVELPQVPADATQVYDATVQPATHYWYMIRACIRDGVTGAEGCSLPRYYQDLYTALLPATNLRAFVTYASSTTETAETLLTWQANTSPFYVQRDDGAGGWTPVAGCSNLSGTRCRDRNVPWRSIPYTYRVGGNMGGTMVWTTAQVNLDIMRILAGNFWALADTGQVVGDGVGHGVGWVNANSDSNPRASPSVRYSVQVDADGLISGAAWASVERDTAGYDHGYGWLVFDAAGLVGCPDAPTQREPGPPCEARWIDPGTGDPHELSGWAKFVQGDPSSAATTWSGWVSLRGTVGMGANQGVPGTAPADLLALLSERGRGALPSARAQEIDFYGITYDPVAEKFEGAAWGDDVAGWIAPKDLHLAGVGSASLPCPSGIIDTPNPTSIRLNWTNPVAYDTLTLTRTAPPPPAQVRSGSVPAGSDTVTDNGLAPNTLYTYRFDGVQGSRSCTATWSARTLAQPGGGDGYTVACAPQGETSVLINWTGRFSGNSPHLARVYGARSSEPPLELLTQRAAQLVPPTPPEVWSAAGSYQHVGLDPNEEYRYRMDATFTGGPRSGETVTAGPVTCRTTSASDAPTNLNATGLNASTIFISWRDNAYYVHDWEIERIKVTPLPSQFSAPPTFINPTTLRFSWQNNTNSQPPPQQKSPFYHVLERSTDSGFPPPVAAATVSFPEDRVWSGTRTSYTGEIGGVAEGTTHYFRVKACSYLTVDTVHRLPGETITPTEIVCSALTPASFYTMTAPPLAPDNFSGAPMPGGIVNLQWIDNSNVEDGFELKQTPPNSPPRTFLIPPRAGTGSVFRTVGGLTGGETYTFEVRAYKGTGADRVYSAPAVVVIQAIAGRFDVPLASAAGAADLAAKLSTAGNALESGWSALAGFVTELFGRVTGGIESAEAQIGINPPVAFDLESYFTPSRRPLLFINNPSGFLDGAGENNNPPLDAGSVYIYRVRATYENPIPGDGTRSPWSTNGTLPGIAAGKTAPSGTGCTETPVVVRVCHRFSYCGTRPGVAVNCPGYPPYVPRNECTVNNDCRSVGTS